MERNTFAGTSARRYRIVDAEERFMLNSFQYNIRFYQLLALSNSLLSMNNRNCMFLC
jgi:hypothetical protein